MKYLCLLNKKSRDKYYILQILNYTMENSRISIKIGIFGAVSVGKTTFLNALFAEDLAESKRKKCTLVPHIYQEFDISNDPNKIKSMRRLNREQNKIVLDKLEENPKKFNIELCKPIKYEVEKLFRFFDNKKLDKDIYLDIYDLPGLDDSTNRDIYFKWVDNNFHVFDVVIFMTDIDKSLNQIGEIDILNLIFKNITRQKEKSVYFIPVINKCDTFTMDKTGKPIFNTSENNDSDDDSIETDENEEMYSQANSILLKKLQEHHLEKNLISSFIPFSAENAFIFRLLAKHPEADLDKKLLDKLGNNEYGQNNWRKMSKTEKETALIFIKDLLKKQKDYEEMIIPTGFINLKNTIEDIICSNKTKLLKNQIINEIDVITKISPDEFDAFLMHCGNLIVKTNILMSKFNVNTRQLIYDHFNNLLKEYFTVKYGIITADITANNFLDKCIASDSVYNKFLKTNNDIINLREELMKFIAIINKQMVDINFVWVAEKCVFLNKRLGELASAALLKYDLDFKNFHAYYNIDVLFERIVKGTTTVINDNINQFILRLRNLNDNNFEKFIEYDGCVHIIKFLVSLTKKYNIVYNDVFIDLIQDKIMMMFNKRQTINMLNAYIYLTNVKNYLKNILSKNKQHLTNNKIIRLKDSLKYLLNAYFKGDFILSTSEINYSNGNIDFEKVILDNMI